MMQDLLPLHFKVLSDDTWRHNELIADKQRKRITNRRKAFMIYVFFIIFAG